MQVDTGASEDRRLVRAGDRRRATDASPRLFRNSTCCGQRGTRIRHQRATKQPGPQGGAVEQAGIEF